MSDYENVFKLAADQDLTCADCKYCQMNLKIKDRTMGWHCYHDDAMQTALHGKTAMVVDENFLCKRFEMDGDT